MGAILMDHVVVHSNSIIAAGALVTKGTVIEENSVYAGTPAKKIKTIDKGLSEGEIQRIANSYNMYASWYSL
jgi:carbonic anhydrase/acetyltransferase-like protein (isoleucine patch superfamily)